MGRLKAAQRRKIPSSKFAYPRVRKYPIDTPGRARAALRLSALKSTYGSYAHVRKKVASRYPSIGKKTRSKPRRRR